MFETLKPLIADYALQQRQSECATATWGVAHEMSREGRCKSGSRKPLPYRGSVNRARLARTECWRGKSQSAAGAHDWLGAFEAPRASLASEPPTVRNCTKTPKKSKHGHVSEWIGQRERERGKAAAVSARCARVKNGKVVVLLNGRFAGRKAIVVKTFDEGHGDRKFAHAIGMGEAPTIAVAGIDRYPRKVTRSMGKNKLKKRSKVKPFVKYVNYNHIMPTRYVADIDLKKVLDGEVLANPETRIESRKTIKKVFEERYLNQAACKSEKKAAGVSFFFKKLRF
ncbi:60S ribosomal protein L27 [Phytophthora pseudosyringae]|uniref:60S ribosomal protein L27 n=1 Tax=Phytophthora pseudosyringae TaxID=221518 RepID=A0A8T1VWB8_9STRA|nr:60S ribosomal protein L27 [Phytophthora pseudosyringae]